MIEFKHPVICGLDRKWTRRWSFGFRSQSHLGFSQDSKSKSEFQGSKPTFDRCFTTEHMILLKCLNLQCEENEVAIHINQ